MNVPIIPPPDLRNIVDKAALFVARNGPEFESKIQQNEQSNPKFNFLKIGDPYNAYYQFKVREIREGGGTATSTNNQQTAALPNGEANKSTVTAQPTTNQVQSKLIRSFAEKVQIVPKEPPPEYEFTIEPPSMLAQDLDIIKLTAQFVAIHGRSFLTSLMNKEQRNYQFDFLRPQHGLFSYFSQLIEQYTKILNQAGEILDDLHRELEPDVTWRRVKYRYEWTKIKEAEKQKEQEEIERERLQYAQIDWHDFVVVETVDYQINEQGIFPPPTTPEQVGSRVLHQQRVEEEHMKEKQLASVGELNAESNGELNEAAEANGEENGDQQQKQKDKQMMPPPTSLSNVVIRKDYDPRQAKKQATSGAASSKLDGWVISPITNEKISAEKLAEHMRYGLLDPRWVEQREKAMQEKLQQEEVFAPGVSIESSLKQMAERRTDIFGVGIDETEIGKKIGEEEVKAKDKITWDGYSSSAEATARAARTNISIEDQIQQIHKIKGLVEEENKPDKIGPAFVPPPSGHSNSSTNMPSKSNIGQTNKQLQPMQTGQPPHQMPPSQQAPRLFMPSNMPPAGLHHPAAPMHPGLIPGHLMNAPQQFPPISNPMMGLHYPPMPPMPHGLPQHVPHSMPSLPPFMPPGHPPPPAPLDEPSEPIEPATKKQRTEDSLVPEEEWLASHSGSLSLNVSVPNMPEKPELNLNGQTLAVTLNLTDMVSVIKSKINEQLGLAPGKQKLQYDGIFIKDSNTLAFYNMMEGSVIQLALKERGGKKK